MLNLGASLDVKIWDLQLSSQPFATLVILSGAKNLTDPMWITLANLCARSSDWEIPHFVRDDSAMLGLRILARLNFYNHFRTLIPIQPLRGRISLMRICHKTRALDKQVVAVK